MCVLGHQISCKYPYLLIHLGGPMNIFKILRKKFETGSYYVSHTSMTLAGLLNTSQAGLEFVIHLHWPLKCHWS